MGYRKGPRGRVLAPLFVALATGVCAGIGTVGGQARADEPTPGAESFTTYCSQCHPVAGRGGSLHVEAPDLALLSLEYGTPLPTVELLDVILPEAVPVGTPYCGKFVLPDYRGHRFAELARRGTVLEILRFLDAMQVSERAQGR